MLKQLFLFLILTLCLPAHLLALHKVRSAMTVGNLAKLKPALYYGDKALAAYLFARDFKNQTIPALNHAKYCYWHHRPHASGNCEVARNTPATLVAHLTQVASVINELCKKPGVKINPAELTVYYDRQLRTYVNVGIERINVSDSFFTLGPRQQKALLSHELMHIRARHPSKTIAGYIGMPILTMGSFYATAYLLQKYAPKNKAATLIATTLQSNVLQYTTSIFLQRLYSRRIEKEADMHAATLLGAAPGLTEICSDHMKSLKKSWFNKLIYQFFSTHPTLSSRINYLKPYLSQS